MRDLVYIHYPHTDQIRVVMDDRSTDTVGALYEAFPAPQAHRVLQRLEFHFAPKHASWLNMVEIEIGALRGQCPTPRQNHLNCTRTAESRVRGQSNGFRRSRWLKDRALRAYC
jgi:hypothetical protein